MGRRRALGVPGELPRPDAHGQWAGCPAGTRLARPGNAFVSPFAWVLLLPDGLPRSASFYDSLLGDVSVYVDMSTPPVWADAEVSMVDLARRSADQVFAAVAGGAEPFGLVGQRWLQAAQAVG